MPRIIIDPFELSDVTHSGWTFRLASAHSIRTDVPNRVDGYGGSRFLQGRNSNFDWAWAPYHGYRKHVRARIAVYLEETVTDARLNFYTANRGSSVTQLIIAGTAGTWKAYRGSTEIGDTGINGVHQTWVWVEVEIYQHDTLGIYKVWIDEVLAIDFSGDTDDGSGAMEVFAVPGKDRPCYDDMVVQDIAISYDGGTGGTPVAGETITDATTGATAIITEVIGDATSGRLILEGWTGAADFGNDNQITSTGTFDALVYAPNATYVSGLEPHSTYIGPGWIVAVAPNANGATSGMAGSDGDSVDNFALVNGLANSNNPASYVYALAVGVTDTYKGDVAGANIMPGASIHSVSVATYAQSALTGVDGIEGIVRVGGTDYSSDRLLLGASHGIHINTFGVDPSIADTADQSWGLGTLTAASFEYGNKSVS